MAIKATDLQACDGATAPQATRFGRIRIWHDESPVSCTAALALSLVLAALLWLVAIRAGPAPDRDVALALQPVLEDRGLGDSGVEDTESSASLEQDALVRDSSASDRAADMSVPEIEPAAAETLEPGVDTGNIADMLRQSTADLNAALELLQQRRAAEQRPQREERESKQTSREAYDKARAASGRAGRGAPGQQGPQSAKFFGLGADDTASVVYVIDCSGSMGRPPQKIELAKHELMRSILALRADQKFYVIFFNHDFYPMPGEKLLDATDRNKEEAVEWIRNVYATGGTNPFPAMQLALELGPESIYLLSDGRFGNSYVDAIQLRNRGPKSAAIYTVGFGPSGGEAQLMRLASENGGTFRLVRP